MDDQTRQANVVLTADTSNYNQQISQSATETGKLSQAVDGLSKKLNDLSKSAGRKLMVLSAADTALVVAGTVAYANFEHQMSTLNAQAAVLNKTFGTSRDIMGTYSRTVRALRSEFPTTTAEAAQLVQVLSKFTGASDGVQKLAETFMKAQGATGESASAIASSMLNLQKQMGTSTKETKAYTDQAISLASTTNTSVTALTDFASSLAPIGKLAGMNQTALMGVSTAFARAGADGNVAATAFSRIMSDVTQATQTGSPALAKYANLIGMTSEQFKEIGASEGTLRIMDQLSKLGPQAIVQLNRLGLDGMRTARSLTALSNQSGGLRGAISEAKADYGSGATDAGAEAGFGGMSNQLKKFSESLKMIAEQMGSTFAPAMEGFTAGLTKSAQVVNSVLSGPFGKLLSWATAMAAPLAGVAGGLLLVAGGLMKFAVAGALFKSHMAEGIRDAYRGNRWGGGAANMAGAASLTPVGQKMLTDAELIAAGQRPVEKAPGRAMYRSGMGLGSLLFGAPADRGKISLMSQAMAMPMRGAALGMDLINQSYSPGTLSGMRDPSTRAALFQKAKFSDYLGLNKQLNAEAAAMQQASAVGGPFKAQTVKGIDLGLGEGRKLAGMDAMKAYGAAGLQKLGLKSDPMEELNKAQKGAAKELVGFGKATGQLAGKMPILMSTLASVGLSFTKSAVLLSAGVTRFLASQAISFVKSNPLMAAAAVGGAAWFIHDQMKDKTEYKFDPESYGVMSKYGEVGGQTANTALDIQRQMSVPDNISMAEATTVSSQDIAYATGGSYKIANPNIEKYNQEGDEFGLEAWKRQVAAENLGGGLGPAGAAAAVNDTIARFGPQAGKDVAAILSSATNQPIDAAGYLKDFSEAGSKEETGDISSATGQAFATRSAAAGAVSAELQGVQNVRDINSFIGQKTIHGESDLGGLQDAIEKAGDLFAGSDFDLSKFDPTADVVPGAGISYEEEKQILLSGDPKNQRARFEDMSEEDRKKYLYTSYLEGMDTEELADFYEKTKGITSASEDIATNVKSLVKDGTQPIDNAELFTAQENNLKNFFSAQATGDARTSIFASEEMTKAEVSEDPNDAATALFATLDRLKGSNYEGARRFGVPSQLGTIQAGLSGGISVESPAYQTLTTAQQYLQQQVANRAVFQTRPEAFKSQTDATQALLDNLEGDPNEGSKRIDYVQQQKQAVVDQAGYLKSLAIASREFEVSKERGAEDFATTQERMEEQYNISRERAEADFSLSRQYAQFDFDLARRRSDIEYNISRHRSEQNFNISRERSTEDFYRGRRRQEEDFNHSVELMTKQAATTMYSIYQRVEVKRTQDAGVLMTNSRDQLKELRAQKHNLEQLRQMGVSDATIQMMGFNDPANAQQLARFVSDLQQRPGMVKQFNRQANARQKAAGALVTDESSIDWQEMTHQFKLNRERGYADFRRGMRQSRDDFNRSMRQAQDDYQRSLQNQAEDFERMMERQQHQFKLTMTRGEEDYALAVTHMVDDYEKQQNRAAHDFNRMATDMSGSIKRMGRLALRDLSGMAREQVTELLGNISRLRERLHIEEDKIVGDAERTFGVQFTGGIKGTGAPNSTGEGAGPNGVPHGGGSAPHMPAMGSRTRRKSGNDDKDPNIVFWPVPRNESSVGRPFGYPDPQYATGHHTGQDFPAATGTPIFAILDGEVESTAWGGAYGNLTKLYHGKNDNDQDVETWYAHQSHQNVHPGNDVEGGQKIGNVGETGNTQGAHLHLEYRLDGQYYDPMTLLGKKGVHYTEGDGPDGGDGSKFSISKFMKKIYPAVERAAERVTLGGGFPENMWSHTLNSMAIRGLRKAAVEKGTTLHAMIEQGTGDPGSKRYSSVDTAPASAKGVWNALVGSGHSKAQAAGIMGNMQSESGFNPFIVQGGGTSMNPRDAGSGGYGLVQWTPGAKLIPYLHGRKPSVASEINALNEQLAGKGGSPEGAAGAALRNSHTIRAATLAFELMYERHAGPPQPGRISQAESIYRKFAGNGAVFGHGAQNVVVGERGPEVVLPLDHKGAEFISALMKRMSVGSEARGMNARGSTPMRTSHVTQNYKIDKSSTFTGPITVKADDARGFFHSVKEQQRHGALSAPSLSSSS